MITYMRTCNMATCFKQCMWRQSIVRYSLELTESVKAQTEAMLPRAWLFHLHLHDLETLHISVTSSVKWGQQCLPRWVVVNMQHVTMGEALRIMPGTWQVSALTVFSYLSRRKVSKKLLILNNKLYFEFLKYRILNIKGDPGQLLLGKEAEDWVFLLVA